MKTDSKDLMLVWDDLQEIFLNFRKFNSTTQDKLERLGFRVVYNSKHPKMYIERNGVTHVVTLCTTPSDGYAGRQILRKIRSIYERY